MYENAKSCVRLNGQFTDEFNSKVGVHQGAVPSPLLFIIVMETTYRAFKVGCHWELLYADDLVLMAETLEGLKKKLTIWKDNIAMVLVSNSIFCQTSNHWVHKSFLKIKGRLKADPSFKCSACTNNITISQDDPEKIIRNDKSKVVRDFIGHLRSCFEATSERLREACKNFHSLLPVLTNSAISLKDRGMHTMSVFVVYCYMLVKLRPLK